MSQVIGRSELASAAFVAGLAKGEGAPTLIWVVDPALTPPGAGPGPLSTLATELAAAGLRSLVAATTFPREPKVGQVDALAAADPDIRLVIRELPILTPQSLPLAQIALAASYQGLYLEVHKAMMTARSVPSPEAALAIVASLGGDPEQILADMNRPEIGLHIRRNLERALGGGIRSTPGFIVQGLPFAGYIGQDQMAELFELLKQPENAGADTGN